MCTKNAKIDHKVWQIVRVWDGSIVVVSNYAILRLQSKKLCFLYVALLTLFFRYTTSECRFTYQ